MAVADANALMATIVPLPWSIAARQALASSAGWTSPALVQAELANAIWKAVRSGTLTPDQGARGLLQALSLVTQVVDLKVAQDALLLANRLNHAVYDCFYLSLALQTATPLLTADRKLQSLAKQIGVEVMPLN